MPLILGPTITPPSGPSGVVSSDGLLTLYNDFKYEGVLLIGDFSSLPPNSRPSFVNIHQIFNGKHLIVRGGEMQPVRENLVVAYDFEAPIGQRAYWSLDMYGRLGAFKGTTQTVGWTTLEPAGIPGDGGLWIKVLNRPQWSLQVQINDWPEDDYTLQSDLQPVWGRQNPIGGLGVVTGFSGELTVLLHTSWELQRMRNLITMGTILLFDPKASFGKRRFYGVINNAKIANATKKMSNPARLVTLNITEVDRPSTMGQRIVMPGRHYEDRLHDIPRYSSIPPRTYLDVLTK